MCLEAHGIDDNGGGRSGGGGRVRKARGLSNDDRYFKRGKGIHGSSDGSETTTEAAGDK